jgi:hypothetical protein
MTIGDKSLFGLLQVGPLAAYYKLPLNRVLVVSIVISNLYER